MLSGLLEDTLEVHDLAVELMDSKDDADVFLEDSFGYAAYIRLHEIANKLSQTSLAELKSDGVKTSITEGNPPAFSPFQCRMEASLCVLGKG